MQINLFRKSGAAITTSTEVNCKNTVTPAQTDSNCRGDYIIVSLCTYISYRPNEILNIVVVNHYIVHMYPNSQLFGRGKGGSLVEMYLCNIN